MQFAFLFQLLLVPITVYARPGFDPGSDTEHVRMLASDSTIDSKVQRRAVAAALVAKLLHGGSRVLARRQAGMNRWSRQPDVTVGLPTTGADWTAPMRGDDE
jgi:hypothetical protein